MSDNLQLSTDSHDLFLKKHRRWFGLGVFCLGLVWALFFNLGFGYGILSSDSHFYLGHAQGFQETGLSHILEVKLPFYYWILPTILAGLKTVFGTSWQEGYLAVQCIASGLFYLGCFQIATHLRGWKAGLLTLAFGLVCYEFLGWSRYVLTDTIFAAIVVCFVYRLLRLESSGWRSKSDGISAIFLFLLTVIARPIGFLIPFALSLYLFFRYIGELNRYWKIRVIAGLFSMIVMGVFIIVFVWEDYGLQRYFDVFSGFYENGIIIKHRPAYDLSNEALIESGFFGKLIFVAEIILYRVMMFWNPFIEGYSTSHLFFNAFTLLPYFVLTLYAVVRNFRAQFMSLIMVLFTVTLFHSLTIIDSDHRYRVPLLGIVLVLSGIGALDLVEDGKKLLKQRLRSRGDEGTGSD